MALNNAKHIIGEIDGVKCTIVESGISSERAAFLKQLLEFNNLEVKELKVDPQTPGSEATYTIGVTSLIFNPVFAVYELALDKPEGGKVSPGYWNQECIDCDPWYWRKRKGQRR
jgi:hypothetical protein